MISESNDMDLDISDTLVLKPRLNIFDFERSFNSSKAKKNLTGIDKEIYEYLSEPVKSINPVEYWKTNKDSFPLLYSIFKKLFSIPASSVPAEQLFSHAGYNIWDRRNKLKPLNVNKMMVLYENHY